MEQNIECIYCKSPKVTEHIQSQGFGAGKAVGGALLLGPLGLLGGFINKNKLKLTYVCSNCGKYFSLKQLLTKKRHAANLKKACESPILNSFGVSFILSFFLGLFFTLFIKNFGISYLTCFIVIFTLNLRHLNKIKQNGDV